jgi:hypothetical protein
MSIAWLLAAGVSLLVGGIEDKRTDVRLRALDPLAAAAIEGGLRRSPTFAELVQAIEGSEFVVYVESSRKLKGGMTGCLVHGGAGPRYLRVLLKTGLSVDERIEVLAHELQHVREVIQAGILNDSVAMDVLFSSIGFNKRQQGGRQQEYETKAALQISAAVREDLRMNRHHSAGESPHRIR